MNTKTRVGIIFTNHLALARIRSGWDREYPLNDADMKCAFDHTGVYQYCKLVSERLVEFKIFSWSSAWKIITRLLWNSGERKVQHSGQHSIRESNDANASDKK